MHSRDAIGDTYNILKDYKLRGSIHAFSGSVEMAQEFIKLGYMIGVGGVVTFKNAKNIKVVVKSVPLAYILLETDSPYLTPEPYRGEVNSSKIFLLLLIKLQSLKRCQTLMFQGLQVIMQRGYLTFLLNNVTINMLKILMR